MKNVFESVMVFLLVFVIFFIAGVYLVYKFNSMFGLIAGFLLSMIGLVLGGIVVAKGQNKSKRKGM
ncbi:MAG: hypothetical protein V4722_26495 [Bacteroidota bacterium]